MRVNLHLVKCAPGLWSVRSSFSPDAQESIIRISQEDLNNVFERTDTRRFGRLVIGVYDSPPGSSLRLSVKDDRLVFHLPSMTDAYAQEYSWCVPEFSTLRRLYDHVKYIPDPLYAMVLRGFFTTTKQNQKYYQPSNG